MNNTEIENKITSLYPDCDLQIEGEDCSFSVTVVSPSFEGLNQVKRQQSIYGLFTEPLKTGELHALTIKAYTPNEWNAKLSQSAGLVSIKL